MTLLRVFFRSALLGIIVCAGCSGQTSSAQGAGPGVTQSMKRVTGIGGVFFKAKNPDSLRAWYRRHLGIEVEAWGGHAFRWRSESSPEGNGTTAWAIVSPDSRYFGPRSSPFMINYRVDSLKALLAALRAEGCAVDSDMQESEYGKFGYVMDPEGNRIELWQPPPGR